MKRKTCLLLAALLGTLSLSSCSAKTVSSVPNNEKFLGSQEAADEAKEVAAGEQEDAQQDADNASEEANKDSAESEYEAKYAPVFDEIEDIIRNGYDFEKQYPYAPSGMIEMSHWMETDELLSTVGYTILDINDDEVPELFIGTIPGENPEVEEKSVVFNGYTYKDGEIATFLEGWARNSYQWLGDNRFYNSGSGGAMYSAFGSFAFDPSKEEMLVAEDFYFTDAADGSYDLDFYHNTTGAWEVEKAEKLKIESEAFWEIMQGYEEKTKQMPFRPLSERFPENASKTEAEPTEDASVTADFLEDVTDKIGTFEEAGDYFPEYDRQGGKKSEYEVMVVFRTKEDVSDFSFLSLELKDVDSDGQAVFASEKLFSIPSLKADTPFAIPMTFPGDTPTNGISYQATDGTVKTFSLSLSGYDGSIEMAPIKLPTER